jgi:translation initiation factor 3 subunit D
MTAPKSLYSWDVQFKKHQDKIFIDKREDTNMLDYLTVNETSHESQPADDDSVNGVRALLEEAKKVQERILYQECVKKEEFKHSLKEKDPFIEDEHQIAVR